MRYRTLAERLATQIRLGELQPNQRLPSLRQLAKAQGVSLTTAQNCYQWLEAEGWISAVPKSGFYVRGATQTAPQPRAREFISAITQPSRTAVDLPGVALGPLGISQLAPTLLPAQPLQRAMKRALQRMGQHLHQYPDRQGERPLQRALHSHFQRYQLSLAPETWVITHGCLDAVRAAVVSCTRAGDTIAINSPCFNGLLNLLAGLHRRVVEIPATDDGIDLVQLEHHLARGSIQAGLFSTSHLNPQGTSLTPAQKQRLAALAAHYQTPIIEDDVFLELSFDKTPPLPAKHWDQAGYILWCGSVSKTLSAGLRLGWCVPGRYLASLLNTQLAVHYGVNPHTQLAVADILHSGDYHRHLQKMRPLLASQVRAYRNHIHSALPGAAISNPTGGTVLWVEVPGLDTQRLARTLHAHNVDVRIGADFSTRQLYPHCFRVNAGFPLVDADRPTEARRQLDLLLTSIQQMT